jgi:hypothetical protein
VVLGRLGSAAGDAAVGPPVRWAGAVTRLPGTWLPALAVLSRQGRGVDDPATSWQTESWDFDQRLTVHAGDRQYASDVLAPHVMAVLLDQLPGGAALTVSGDAAHAWWPYRDELTADPGRVERTVAAAAAFADALPRFVRDRYPDRSEEVQADLDAGVERVREYQQTRRPGHSPDPVMQRIYDQARVQAGLPPAT